ncbi:MAG: hypothetical protein Q8S00_32305 [Deltaproteobacteria bacterium]|nr:hypothetical protein [Deltaproteobacteria bacterium]
MTLTLTAEARLALGEATAEWIENHAITALGKKEKWLVHDSQDVPESVAAVLTQRYGRWKTPYMAEHAYWPIDAGDAS